MLTLYGFLRPLWQFVEHWLNNIEHSWYILDSVKLIFFTIWYFIDQTIYEDNNLQINNTENRLLVAALISDGKHYT